MAWEDITERLEGLGWLGVGLGAVLVAPALVPAVAKGLRPAAKGAIKGYLTLTDKAREMFGETTEQWQDLVAEAKSEHENRSNGAEMMTMELPAGEPKAEEEAAKPKARAARKEEESRPDQA